MGASREHLWLHLAQLQLFAPLTKPWLNFNNLESPLLVCLICQMHEVIGPYKYDSWPVDGCFPPPFETEQMIGTVNSNWSVESRKQGLKCPPPPC